MVAGRLAEKRTGFIAQRLHAVDEWWGTDGDRFSMHSHRCGVKENIGRSGPIDTVPGPGLEVAASAVKC